MTRPTKSKLRDPERTRARILEAAQQAFAEMGYSAAGLRDIAAIAGVSSPLLLHYFDTKASLFEAALIGSIRLDPVIGISKVGFGVRLTARLRLEQLDTRAHTMMVLSTGDAEAREIATRVTEEHAIRPLAEWLGPPDERSRAAEIVMLMTSFVLYTRQIPVLPQGCDASVSAMDWLAKSLQEIVDRS